jgi:hypothetical protein
VKHGRARETASVSEAEVVAWIAGLGLLMTCSAWLAVNRIFQVDEFQNIFVARLLVTGQGQDSFTAVSLFLAPLAVLARGATESVSYLTAARLVAWALFWLNLFLMATACGEKLWSRRGMAAVIGAATLAPLWDYGFEIRHDNLLLTGLLLLWISLRILPRSLRSYALAGAVVVLLAFVAFKALVYALPVALLAMAYSSTELRPSWLKLCGAWIGGALVAFLLVRIGYGVAGWWDIYVRDLMGVFSIATDSTRVGPEMALGRLKLQVPLLSACTVLGFAVVVYDIWRQRARNVLDRESMVAYALLALVALGALLINPLAYPYNLVNLVPFMYLFSWRLAWSLAARVSNRQLVERLAIVLVIGHVLPFGMATHRHFEMTNARQEELVELAERLTDPGRDRVYDGIGMVPTRSSIHGQWFLHSLNIRSFRNGTRTPVREMLAAQPAAVIIPSYRTAMLSKEDDALIYARYVPLANDFWVLGSVLPAGGGRFEIVHAGRYGLATTADSVGEGSFRRASPVRGTPLDHGTIDRMPITTPVVELEVGVHTLECTLDCRPVVVWLGPTLSQVPRIESRDHRVLFRNWY